MATRIHRHGKSSAVIKPMGKFWDAPGHPLDGKEMCECKQCGTSVSHHIRPYAYRQLRDPKKPPQPQY